MNITLKLFRSLFWINHIKYNDFHELLPQKTYIFFAFNSIQYTFCCILCILLFKLWLILSQYFELFFCIDFHILFSFHWISSNVLGFAPNDWKNLQILTKIDSKWKVGVWKYKLLFSKISICFESCSCRQSFKRFFRTFEWKQNINKCLKALKCDKMSQFY